MLKVFIIIAWLAGAMLTTTVRDPNAIGLIMIVSNDERADTAYVTIEQQDTITTYVFCYPYQVYKAVSYVVTELDTSEASPPCYFICTGHLAEGEGVVFSYDSLNVIVQADSIYRLEVILSEQFTGFFLQGSNRKAPVVRNTER